MVLYGYLWVFRTFSEKAKINMLTLCREWVRICCLSAFQNESVAIFMRTSRKNIQKSQRKFPYKSMTYQRPSDSACIISQIVYYNSILTNKEIYFDNIFRRY